MSTPQRRSGLVQFARNGVLMNAKGNFTYNLGRPKREAIIGADGTHGFMEKAQVAFIEGEVTDSSDLDMDAMVRAEDETVTLILGNGKVIVLNHAWYAGDGTGNSEEGNIQVRFEALNAEEVA